MAEHKFELELIAPVDTSNPVVMHQFLHNLVDQLVQRTSDLDVYIEQLESRLTRLEDNQQSGV